MKQPKNTEASGVTGSRRPPDYVIVVAVSPWAREHFPDGPRSIDEVSRASSQQPHEPEADLEAEP